MTTKSDRSPAVAIIGGGASGTLLAVQLARRGIRSALIDGSGRVGKGVAFSTTEPVHVLNVRAEGMSALAGEPGHFADAFAEQGGGRRDFAERRVYARYLGDLLQSAIDQGCVEIIDAQATAARRTTHGWAVECEDGLVIEAPLLALASGNQDPARLSAFDGVGDRYVGNPWGEEARYAISDLAAGGQPVMLIGTGLTMVDLALSLDAAGYEGKIVALSRRGLAPRPHAEFDPAPIALEDVPLGDLGALTRWLRRRGAEVGWRAAIDSLRPHSHAIWQSLDVKQQHRFMRHARPWWDAHRHRIAPQVGDTLVRMIGEGRLQIVAGQIVAARAVDGGLTVDYRRRGSADLRSQNFAYAINCTGPLQAMAQTMDRVLRGLIDAGDARVDKVGIGLAIDDRGRAGAGLWAIGPLTKGKYWEIIAIPDIREQAAAIAAEIERELER